MSEPRMIGVGGGDEGRVGLIAEVDDLQARALLMSGVGLDLRLECSDDGRVWRLMEYPPFFAR